MEDYVELCCFRFYLFDEPYRLDVGDSSLFIYSTSVL